MSCPADSITNILDIPIRVKYIQDRAYYIWKRYGNQNEQANYFQAVKELRMEIRMNDVFNVFNMGDDKCTLEHTMTFGRFLAVDWSLMYLRETFDVFDATEDYKITRNQFITFCVDELNGLDINSFNMYVEGFIAYYNLPKGIKEELEQCYVSINSTKCSYISSSDAIHICHYLQPSKDKGLMNSCLSLIDHTKDGYITRYEFLMLMALFLPDRIEQVDLTKKIQMYNTRS